MTPARPVLADLAGLSIAEMGRGLRAARFSCTDLADAALASIDRTQSTLNAFTFVDSSRARADARRLDRELRRGRDRGPLHGVPVAVKDLVAVAGVTMRAGSIVYERRPRTDAPIVAQLRAAGAVIVGLTRLHEIALATTGLNPHDGGARNPRAFGHIPGGSSSGSAVAVAAGSVPLAIGTDTGGSVRIPAALCGVVGLKPTFDLLPTAGVMPLAPSLDHVGFLARSIDDVATALEAVADVRRVPSASLAGARLAVLASAMRDLEGPVARAHDRSLTILRTQGARIAQIELEGARSIVELSATILLYEAYRVHEKAFRADPSAFGADVRQRLADGRAIKRATYEAALRDAERLRSDAASAFAEHPFILSPTVPVLALAIPDAAILAKRDALPRNTRLFNVLGAPAVSIPALADGLPVGLQIAAARGQDAALLALGAAVERAFAQASARSVVPP